MRRTILLLLTLVPMMVQAQMLKDYTVTSVQGTWNSIAQTGTPLTSVVGDYGSQTVALPFDFDYGLSTFPAGTNITVRCDGFVKLRGDSWAGSHNAVSYWDNGGNAIICPFLLFDGQMPEGTSGCWYQTMTDAAGNQMLVIEWRQVQHFPTYPMSAAEASQDDFNYQLRLHENGDISCVYGNMYNGVTTDTLFNFFLTDGDHYWDWEYAPGMVTSRRDHVSLCGTWDSVVVNFYDFAYRNGNNWVEFPAFSLVGCPSMGTTVTYHRPQCPYPEHVVVNHLRHNSALISCTHSWGEAAQLYVQYDTVDFTPGSAGHPSLYYSGDSVLLSGLLHERQYWVKLRRDCGVETSEWYELSFQTPCPPLTLADLPFFEDFQGLAEDDSTLWEGCWGRRGMVNVNTVDYYGYYNSDMGLWMTSNAYFHLPPVDSIQNTVLHFRARNYYGSASQPLWVGVLDKSSDFGSFNTIERLEIGPEWQEYGVSLSSYAGEGNMVALYGSRIIIDGVLLTDGDGCLPVKWIGVVPYSHSAVVHWMIGASYANCRVVWYPVGAEWLADSVTSSNGMAAIAGLTPNTEYVVEVYVICGDGSLSAPRATTFRTACFLPLPLVEDFDGMDELPECWDAVSRTDTYYSLVSNEAPVPVVADDAVRLASKYVADSVDIIQECGGLLFPVVDANGAVRLSFDYRVERNPGQVMLEVGFTYGDELNSFYPIDTVVPADTLEHHYTLDVGRYLYSDQERLAVLQRSTGAHAQEEGYESDLGYLDNIRVEELISGMAGIEESESKNLLVSIYPNPASTTVTVELNEELRMKNEELLKVLDLRGRTVLTQAVKQTGNQAITIDISALPAGIYYLHLMAEGVHAVEKVVKVF